MRYVPAYTKTEATVYHLIAAASATYGVLAMLLACYERNLAAGLLSLIPTIAGISLGTAVIGREDQKGGEAQ
ncbi:hypothetical protein [uncultured Actinomyces sp.]|uniref:hypothetical protein n=1 Tax=uncultured Actinomyces sp. TaxID=249061 RepID=UPI0028EF4DAB|nr:hypothetical protein [uncultured Actinomyces sp.]